LESSKKLNRKRSNAGDSTKSDQGRIRIGGAPLGEGGYGEYHGFGLQNPPFPWRDTWHCAKLTNPQFSAPPMRPPYSKHHG
jgi:hypothetical protein